MSPTKIIVPENAFFYNNSYTRRWSGGGGLLYGEKSGVQGFLAFWNVLNAPISPGAA